MVPRRQAIRLICSSLSIGFAGCSIGGSLGDGATRSPSSTPPDYRFSLEASMVEQASGIRPPQFTVKLTNESSQSVNVSYGQTLMFSAGKTESPAELVIVPAADEAAKQPNSPVDGCWKHPQEQEVTIYAVENNELLAPGGSLSATFAVYTASDMDSCYPPGEYEFRSQVSLDHRQSPKLQLTVVLSIDEDGRIDVVAKPPVETK